MKIRSGFVSNSSSSSFAFVFKGKTVDELCEILPKYKDTFNLSFEDYEDNMHYCNVDDIINALKENVKNPEDQKENVENAENWYDIYPICIDDSILALKEKIKDSTKQLDDPAQFGDWYKEMLQRHIECFSAEIEKLSEAKRRGLNSVIYIEFGDNHGHVSGPGVGYAMRYNSRYISIDSRDLVVYSSENS